jgi:hypothetical protein
MLDFPSGPVPEPVLTVRTWQIDIVGAIIKKRTIIVNLQRNMSTILTISVV